MNRKMPKSLKRQKILFEREMKRLVDNGTYVKTEEGYVLREPVPARDQYNDYFRAQAEKAKERRNNSTQNTPLDDVFSDSGDSKPEDF